MLSPSEARELLIRRLAVIVDEDRPDFIRRAVAKEVPGSPSKSKEVQGTLQPGHPLRAKTPAELLAEIKPPWASRLVL